MHLRGRTQKLTTRSWCYLCEIHPISLVQLWANEEVEVGDEVILSNQRGGETQLAVGIAHTENFPEHLGRDHVYLR